MKRMLLIAGAAALGIAGPALARPGNGHGNGNGNGNGHGNTYAYGVNGQAYGVNGPVGYGHGGCPPGLAKKNPACMPPGQARKLGLGLQVPSGYNLLSYNALPRTVRSHHSLSPRSRYVYDQGTVYQVNPRTRVVQSVIRTR